MKVSLNSVETTEPEEFSGNCSRRWLRYLEVSFWITGGVLGFIHTWADHHYLTNSDALSYLDIAEGYLRGDWSTAVNAYWSPLYSAVIAAGLFIFKPSPYWKFSVLHLLNFAIYLFSFACFSFLIRELVRLHQNQRGELDQSELLTFPDWGWLALGYSLFIWSSIFLMGVAIESPDQLIAGFVYLCCGTLLVVFRRKRSWLPFVFLGIVLGFGFLAKSVMLPLSLPILFAAVVAVGDIRRALPRIILALGTFLLVISPFVTAISLAKGRITFGDSGRLNYLWAIEGVRKRNWQGEDGVHGTPKNRTQKIFDSPPIYAFASKVGGTYPLMYDPSFWYEGSINHFEPKRQLRVFVSNLQGLYYLYESWGVQNALLVVFLSLFLMGRQRLKSLVDLGPSLCLMIPAIAGIGIFSLINIQGRYVGPFVVVLWLALFSALRLPYGRELQRLIACLAIALTVTVMGTVVASSVNETRATARYLLAGEDPSTHKEWLAAEGLKQIGVNPGDQVAVILDGPRSFWAHLSGVRVIAEIEIQDTSAFWTGESSIQSRAIQAFAQTGAKVIVAEAPPARDFEAIGWRKIGNTGYLAYLLK